MKIRSVQEKLVAKRPETAVPEPIEIRDTYFRGINETFQKSSRTPLPESWGLREWSWAEFLPKLEASLTKRGFAFDGRKTLVAFDLDDTLVNVPLPVYIQDTARGALLTRADLPEGQNEFSEVLDKKLTDADLVDVTHFRNEPWFKVFMASHAEFELDYRATDEAEAEGFRADFETLRLNQAWAAALDPDAANISIICTARGGTQHAARMMEELSTRFDFMIGTGIGGRLEQELSLQGMSPGQRKAVVLLGIAALGSLDALVFLDDQPANLRPVAELAEHILPSLELELFQTYRYQYPDGQLGVVNEAYLFRRDGIAHPGRPEMRGYEVRCASLAPCQDPTR